MEITAKFNSMCPTCGNQISAGEKCEWERGQKAKHIKCPTDKTIQAGPKKTGQLWEECRCGREPIYMPLMLCDRCWPKTNQLDHINTSCPEPYRKGIGQGFGSTEDGN